MVASEDIKKVRIKW